MLKYILKRLLISILTIWAVATVCFFLLRLLPGNPFILQNPLDMKNAEKMMAFYGLDRPLWEQYVSYLGNLLRLDFGYSLTHVGRSVNDVIAQYFPITAQLGIQALLLGMPLGMLLGIVSAVWRGGRFDYSCQIGSVISTSIPSFVLAAVMQLVFGVYKFLTLSLRTFKRQLKSILGTISREISHFSFVRITSREICNIGGPESP